MPDSPGLTRRYGKILFALFGAGLLGTGTAVVSAQYAGVRLLLACSSVLALATAAVVGTLLALQARRAAARAAPAAEDLAVVPDLPPAVDSPFETLRKEVVASIRELVDPRAVDVGVGILGALFLTCAAMSPLTSPTGDTGLLATVLGGLAAAAVIAALATRYLSAISLEELPEARGLAAWGRAVSGVCVVGAVGVGMLFPRWDVAVGYLATAVFVFAGVLAIDGIVPRKRRAAGPIVFPTYLRTLQLVASRANPVASIFDKLESAFGIDLRSSWALAVLRSAIEPLIAAVAVLAWLSTSLTVVETNQQGIIEHFGVASEASPEAPGLHLHWPWPLDRVSVVAVREARSLEVGHGGVETSGPENVLWAREHAAQEFSLVLGDGRDLVTVDAAVNFRIRDPRAWLYGCQNPTTALSGIAYRAVMDTTVNRTLADVLSENVAVLTAKLRSDVQRDADAIGLGVEILSFTVGGMHPPVPVARDYQAVVSAQVDRETAIINAQAYAYATIPSAEAEVVTANNTAQAEGSNALAQAAGKAWAFRTLKSSYDADPHEFRFRRRLEALESALSERSLTVLDDRIEKDGGQLWIPE